MKKVHQCLLDWYENCGRHALPWRNTKDIYHIYLSEVMLQQTQVSRVEEYFYPHFLKKYPRLQDLANASLDEVLASWSGLGYYSRARNLHKSMQLCTKEGLPMDMLGLQKLPGVGRYTASAVCSFALNQNVAVVDTNIKRVIKRYFALKASNDALDLHYAEEFLNKNQPRNHNLALMDLGSLICTPKNPQCESCPLSFTCKGKNNPEAYTKKKKTVYENMDIFLGVCMRDNKIALLQSQTNLYKGLLVLPDIEPIEEDFIGSFKHSYTKYKLQVNLYRTSEYDKQSTWLSFEELADAPISSMTKKALELL